MHNNEKPLEPPTLDMQDELVSSNLETQKSSEAERIEETNGKLERYIQGLRLHAITAGLCVGFFIATVEVTIVATALVAITDDLENFDKASWIVNAYMLSFTSFIIIWSKLSDIYGRKPLILLSVVLFVLFSGLCGAAQTTTHLIVFRAFQGLGGSGMYSLTMVMFFDLVPPSKFATYTSGVSMVLGLAMLLGPILGGAITNNTTWRWVFLINVPIGAVLIIVLFFTIPKGFPDHHLPIPQDHTFWKELASNRNLRRTDWMGTALLLAATVLLVTGMEQAGLGYKWDSGLVLSLLLISLVLWLLFLAWERKTTRSSSPEEPIFPFRFLQSPPTIGAILTDFLLGGPFTIGMVQIPQRFQTVHHLSPFQSSLRLLPFGFLVAFGSSLGALICKKAKLPIVWVILLGATLQVTGFTLLSTTPHSEQIYVPQYGYQVIAGIGTGMVLGCLVVIMPFTVQERDKSVAVSAVIQFRTLGGAVFLAIVSSVFLNQVRSTLEQHLPPQQVDAILKSSKALYSVSPELKTTITETLSKGYNLQFRILIGLAAGQIPAALLMWRKDQIIA